MGFQRLIKDKRGLQLQKAFYAIIAFSVLIIAFGVIINETSAGYNSGVSSDLSGLNKLDSVSQDINVQKGRLTPNDPDPGENAEANTFKGVYGIITNLFSPFSTVFGEDGIIDDISYRYGLPVYIRQMLVAFMFVAFIFAIIGIIFRLGRTP